MIETTPADREQELKSLLAQMAAHPERDWSEARDRVQVLRRLVGHTGDEDGVTRTQA